MERATTSFDVRWPNRCDGRQLVYNEPAYPSNHYGREHDHVGYDGGAGDTRSAASQHIKDESGGHYRHKSSLSSSVREPMHDGRNKERTPESDSSGFGNSSPGSSVAAADISHLAIRTDTPPLFDSIPRCHKRYATDELNSRDQKRSPSRNQPLGPNGDLPSYARHTTPAYGAASHAEPVAPDLPATTCRPAARGPFTKVQALRHIVQDSGDESGECGTLSHPQDLQNSRVIKKPVSRVVGGKHRNSMACQAFDCDVMPHQSSDRDCSPLRSQPESIPISQEQLAAEVKGIYAGLVMVEAKCVNIDNQKAANPQENLTTEQWQALIALHRTLLYEHHDFLMATQHPAANKALRGLATKYCMPARMWKHGIHAFLEVLRHRRPHSHEYMLAFIYLAYQMMALLLETVPSFTDTWTECLGDLARYRMAIEEDTEAHAAWGDVARAWYQGASDRHPAVGRLYHHLGILQRPSLCKFFYYSRSLTSVIPFYNARESLTTLCAPILNDKQALRNGSHSAEAMTICFHARVFSNQPEAAVVRDGEMALALLQEQPSIKIAGYGVHLIVTSISALLGFGQADNHYRQMFDQALNYQIHVNRSGVPGPKNYVLQTSVDLSTALRPLSFVTEYLYSALNTIARRQPSKHDIQDLLPTLHISLAWLSSVHTLRSRFDSRDPNIHTLDHLIDHTRLDWSAIAKFLNFAASIYPITSRIEQLARQGMFPPDGKPLHEDYSIRGLVWAQWYFAPDWFVGMEDDDGSRGLDDEAKKTARAERTIWLALRMARQRESCLRYHETGQRFYASAVSVPAKTESLSQRSSLSARSSLESDFVMVSQPSSPPPSLTYAKVVSGSQYTYSAPVKVKSELSSDMPRRVKIEEGTECR